MERVLLLLLCMYMRMCLYGRGEGVGLNASALLEIETNWPGYCDPRGTLCGNTSSKHRQSLCVERPRHLHPTEVGPSRLKWLSGA